MSEPQVGMNLRRVRRGQGLTQEQLAYAAGVSPAMVARIERGTRHPALDVPLSLSLPWDGKMTVTIDGIPWVVIWALARGRPDPVGILSDGTRTVAGFASR